MPHETILVVEDEDAMRELITTLLEGEGYRVSNAGNGEEGLAQMEKGAPDLIVSDIEMPRMDGHAFHDAVRARPQWDGVPFIFLTGRGEPLDVLEAKKLGADDYVVKPFASDELLVAVRARLDRRARLDALRERQVAQVKRAILVTLNHEIRTPVSWLAGGADLLRDAAGDLSTQQVRQILDGILAGSARLVRLAEDLVLLVDLQTGEARRTFEHSKQRLENLPDLLRQCLVREESRAAEKGVQLVLQIPERLPAVRGEPELLANAVHRLLDNAVKFSKRPGSAVTVTAAAEGPRVVIEVRDQGVGVKSEDLARITDLFVQSDRATREQQGTGSGLTIAREIAVLHGGSLGLSSELGVGTTARLELPIC